MSTGIIVAIIVIVVVALALLLWARVGGQRGKLKKQFGPEYDRVVGELGSRKEAETELAARRQRVGEYQLRTLDQQAQDNYETQWIDTQEHFVEAPGDALTGASGLIDSVLTDQGYPVSEYQLTVADLSVHHAAVLDQYRAAHDIAERANAASTEELRLAMLNYRAMFTELLGDQAESAPKALASGNVTESGSGNDVA
jgi:hypothetical protein